ncbi:MAG: threonine/serine dehydratase [Hyphomicrobiales bacterium]
MTNFPTYQNVIDARTIIQGDLVKTPIAALTSDRLTHLLPERSSAFIKLEHLQQAGSFKARGAFIGMSQLSKQQKNAGVVTVSGGNHALAISWAASKLNISAKVVMPSHVDPVRIEGCKALGATVVLVETIKDAFSTMGQIAEDEDRTIMHPFEGEHMTLGSATCAAEFLEASPDLDALIVPIGGGGLISGMSLAAKLHNPNIHVFGVEPFGADAMFQSFQTGEITTLEKVDTIADSLGSPMTAPYSLALARAHVDEIVRVTDDELRIAMGHMMDGLKILAEPACASSLAALIGPLHKTLEGKKVGIIACGSNISIERFQKLTTN